MIKQIESVKKIRNFLFESIKGLTNEQLNKVPAGFNNNIIWNLGHLVAAQQGVCYKRAGLATQVSDDFWEQFRSGTKPEKALNDAEITHIKELFFTTLDQLETDYNNNIFTGYTTWTVRYGVDIASIDDALAFLPYHEGLHSGTIGSLKKFV